jgi:hypothetical protein
MYSTCLFCRADLGRNDLIETFPVGRRLAVDPAKGRLWVICSVCKRWNLSPLEERWEALEDAERIAEKLRPEAASDHIELFTHPSGLRLVRIGEARWREVTHWRYGMRLALRQRAAQLRRGAATVATWGVPLVLTTAFFPALGLPGVEAGAFAMLTAMSAVQRRMLRRPVVSLGDPQDELTVIRGTHLKNATMLPGATPEAWSIWVESDRGPVTLTGADALRVASKVLVRANHQGAGREDVANAVRRIEDAGSAERYIGGVAERVRSRRQPFRYWARNDAVDQGNYRGAIAGLPGITRLTLEIAAHDQLERRALEGELAILDRMWREAEEIAAISDNLLVPRFVVDGLRRLRGV